MKTKQKKQNKKELLFNWDNYKKPNFFRKILLKWEFEWKFIPKKILQGIRNLWTWFPVIWNDRNWDYTYIYSILKTKLEKVYKEIDQKRVTENYQYKLDKIQLAIDLIEKFQKDCYTYEYMDYYEIELYKEPYKENEEFITVTSEVIRDELDIYFEKYPLIVKKYLKQQSEDFDIQNEDNRIRLAIYISYERYKKAKRILFSTLEKHIDTWFI